MPAFEFPWERMAMNNLEMPDGLPLQDQMAYTAMRNIYYSFRHGVITRDAAAAEKLKIRSRYDNMVSEWARWGDLAKYHCKLRKDIEAAATTCRKDPTPEHGMALCNAIDGLEGF